MLERGSSLCSMRKLDFASISQEEGGLMRGRAQIRTVYNLLYAQLFRLLKELYPSPLFAQLKHHIGNLYLWLQPWVLALVNCSHICELYNLKSQK